MTSRAIFFFPKTKAVSKLECIILLFEEWSFGTETRNYLDKGQGITLNSDNLCIERKTATGLSSDRCFLERIFFSICRKFVVSYVLLQVQELHKPLILLTFYDARFIFGGEGEIRTLETLLGFTRFPVVRPRPG